MKLKKIFAIFIISIIVSLTPAIACEISAQNPTENTLNVNNSLIHLVKHPNLSKTYQKNTVKNIKTTKLVTQKTIKKQVTTTKPKKDIIIVKKEENLKSQDKIDTIDKKVSSTKTTTSTSTKTSTDAKPPEGEITPVNDTKPKVIPKMTQLQILHLLTIIQQQAIPHQMITQIMR